MSGEEKHDTENKGTGMSAVQRISPEIRDIHVPAPLRDLPLWLVWAYEQHANEPKPRKVPQYSMGGRRFGQQGSASDRAKLTTFAVARDSAAKRGLDGVGFALMPDAGLVALDFDKCVVDGKVDPEVMELVRGTYAEYSPSGTGIRAFYWGASDVLGNQKSHATPDQFGVEVFSTNGFVTVTGWMLDHIELCGWEDKIAPLPQRVIGFCQKRFGPSSGAVFDPDDFMLGHEPKLGLTVDQMQELLDVLDSDCSRDEWIRVGMALHHECEGDDTGFDLWNEWSELGGKYPGEESLRAQWDSFERRKGSARRQITMASVIRMAKEAGADARPLKAATADDLRRVVAESAEDLPTSTDGATPPEYTGKFPMYRASAIAARPPGRWWIKGLIPEARIGAIFGASGSGKSFFILDLICHLALGWEWRGLRTRKGRVLYVAAEGGAGVGKRIKAWAQHHGVNVDDLDITVLLVAPNIMLREDIEELVVAIKAAGGFEHIVLDTYAQVTPGANENTAEDMGLALAHCNAIAEATDAQITLVHHSGKDATKGARGWSGINAALDFSLEVTRDEEANYREMRVAKMKDGEDGQRFGFKLETVVVGYDDDMDEITSCVVIDAEPVKAEPSTKGLKRRGRMENHILEVMTLFAEQANVRIEHLVNKAVEMLPPPDEGKRDIRRQSIVRALQTLSREKDGPLKVEGNLVFFFE